MSINSLTNEAIRKVPSLGIKAEAIEGDSVGKAIDVLTKYIPIESATLYIALVSSYKDLHAQFSGLTSDGLYGIGVVLTGGIFLALYLGKRRTNGLPVIRFNWLTEFPWWKFLASMIAFAGWALAIPNGIPIQSGVGGFWGIIAVIVASTLALLEPIFDKPTVSPPPPPPAPSTPLSK